MPTGNDAIAQSIHSAVEPGFRDQLLARGQARAMIWRDGQLPADAPPFSSELSYDLLSYGYGLLGQGLRLLENGGDFAVARQAFEQSAEAIESVIQRGRVTPESGFHRIAAAAGYHLGRFSARAYSLLNHHSEDNLTVPERCLSLLMLRDLDGLDHEIIAWRSSGEGTDENIEGLIRDYFDEDGDGDEEDPETDLFDAADLALTDHYVGALATAMLALERGDADLIEQAVIMLEAGQNGAGDLHLVPQWWCHRLTIYLLHDLWECCFHNRLPLAPFSESAEENWPSYRRIFIASLLRGNRAQIELWPSQLEAAAQAIGTKDNLVVSLPTSAGKTRVAELCILACLAEGKRVVFVTPLRALSAQTEAALSKTFAPLGKTVSSLYGSIGVSETDSTFLMDRDIIVSTPEKLDFALRNDPSLLDNVGLVVLDEGHMIGLGEREIRYEVQIQRLLRRADAATRRIVCLSAVLPKGSQLDDFVAWLSNDNNDGLVAKDWRPTRLRFGEVIWKKDHARLNLHVSGEDPWVETYFTAIMPPGRRTLFPRDQRELCLATAWKLVGDGQSVLIFCPERRSVEPFAEAIVKLHRQDGLPSLLESGESELASALAIGAEWFGEDHDLLKCLRLGVGVHHGSLPTPYRKEVERLLREGILPVTISSPTLAQGLNLSASAVVFHGVTRSGDPIEPAQFRNIIGRAGRAYVDVEGVVLYPMFDKVPKRSQHWRALVENQKGHEMESGLFRLLVSLLVRLRDKTGRRTVDELVEYVVNNTGAWTFEKLKSENAETAALAEEEWNNHLTYLDTALFSMLGEQEVADEDIEKKIEEVLASSLFARRLARQNENQHPLYANLLAARARFLWKNSTAKQRRGYFLAGVGYETGKALDDNAAALNDLLLEANSEDDDRAIEAITSFAERVFVISPFAPKKLPVDWKAILKQWLLGEALADFAADDQDGVLGFVEDALVYRLPWAMEAVRVRGLSHGDHIGDFPLDDFELGAAVAAVETGTLNRSAATLIRSGFSSRSAAIKVVTELEADFEDVSQLRAWLRKDSVREKTADPEWPTPETHALWTEFVTSFRRAKRQTWTVQHTAAEADWIDEAPVAGTPLRLGRDNDVGTDIFTADYQKVGTLSHALNPERCGLALAEATDEGKVSIEYLGPDDLGA